MKKTTHNLFLNTKNYTQSFLKIVSMKCFRPSISEVFEVWARNNPSLVTTDKEDYEFHAIVKIDKGGVLSNLSTRKDNSEKLPKDFKKLCNAMKTLTFGHVFGIKKQTILIMTRNCYNHKSLPF